MTVVTGSLTDTRAAEIAKRLDEIEDELYELNTERHDLEDELKSHEDAIKLAQAHPELIVEVQPGVRVIVRETPQMELVALRARGGKSWSDMRALNAEYQALAYEAAYRLEDKDAA